MTQARFADSFCKAKYGSTIWPWQSEDADSGESVVTGTVNSGSRSSTEDNGNDLCGHFRGIFLRSFHLQSILSA